MNFNQFADLEMADRMVLADRVKVIIAGLRDIMIGDIKALTLLRELTEIVLLHPNHPDLDIIAKRAEVAATMTPLIFQGIPCKFMEDTGEAVPERKCQGNYVICHHPDSPIKDTKKGWVQCNCRPHKCNFYTPTEE